MFRSFKFLLLASLSLAGGAPATLHAAEREDVRKVINLITAVKMPFPEDLSRNRARTDRVWLERGGTATGCLVVEERRWCYEHIPQDGSRAEMLRIRSEPSRGAYVGGLHYYIVDFDLEGLVDVGSTTRIDPLDRRPRTTIATVIQFFHRSTRRGESNLSEYQRMYDDGIQVALRYFGE
jgi:hypothetical protein